MITLKQKSSSELSNSFLPDLTSMLDILFILLVFFMITAGTTFRSLNLNVPSSASKDLSFIPSINRILLEIDHDKYALNGEIIYDFEILKIQLLKIISDNPAYEIIISGDKNITISRLLEILIYVQSQKIKIVNILIKQNTSP